MYRVSDWEEVASSGWDSAAISSIALSPDKSLIASACADGKVRVWRVSDGSLLNRLESGSEGVTSVAFSSDGNMLASGHEDAVRLWRVTDGALLNTLEGHTSEVLSLAFSPDGSMLATSDQEGIVRLWRVSDGVLIHDVEQSSEDQNWVNSLSFTPDGEVLSGCGKFIFLWGVSEGNFLKELGWSESSISCMALSSDGTLLVTGSFDSTIQIWGVLD